MKGLIFACLLVVANCTSLLDQADKFQLFKVKYGKSYKNQAEEIERFNIFKQNLQSFEEHNALYEQGLVSYEQGVNQYTDKTEEELNASFKRNFKHRSHFNVLKHVKSGLAIPDSVDWRTDDQVTSIKDQLGCLSCWSFSLIGAIEAAQKRKSGNLVSLSAQQLVDCYHNATTGTGGCKGVLSILEPISYIEQYGVESDDIYPFTAVESDCLYDASKVVAKVSDFRFIDFRDEDGLLEAVANVGPIAVVIDTIPLLSYKSGIFDGTDCTENLNHGVLVIGYGSENGVDFWIVKNSYGTEYGENGYFRLVRGINACGIADAALYPIIN